MTRSRDVSNTQSTTPSAVAPFVAGKNVIINGGHDIWQRGTSSTTTSAYTTSDRWYTTGTGVTFSQDTDVPSGVPVQYSLKWTTSAGSSFGQFYQALEQATVKPLRGQTVTLSAWCKSANYGSGLQYLRVNYSNSTDGLTSQSTNVKDVTIAGNALGSWTRMTSTFTVPSDAVGLAVEFIPDTVQGSGVTFKMTAVQLELGSVATPFSRAGGTIAGELAACQRYYWRAGGDNAYQGFSNGFAINSSTMQTFVQHPVTMRAATSSVDYSSLAVSNGSANYSVSSVTVQTNGKNGNIITASSSGLTGGYGYTLLANNSTSAYLGFSAEL